MNFQNLLADVISHTFKVKINLYSYTCNGQLDCKHFTNKFVKEVNIACYEKCYIALETYEEEVKNEMNQEIEKIINESYCVQNETTLPLCNNNFSEDSFCLKRRRGSFSYHETMASLNHSIDKSEDEDLPLFNCTSEAKEEERGIFVDDEDELSRIFPVSQSNATYSDSLKESKKLNQSMSIFTEQSPQADFADKYYPQQPTNQTRPQQHQQYQEMNQCQQNYSHPMHTNSHPMHMHYPCPTHQQQQPIIFQPVQIQQQPQLIPIQQIPQNQVFIIQQPQQILVPQQQIQWVPVNMNVNVNVIKNNKEYVENKNFIPLKYVYLDESNNKNTTVPNGKRSIGHLKFFDYNKGFGFITLQDGSDVF